MAYLSRQLFFKFACVIIASLLTFVGLMMSMDLLRQVSDKDTELRSHSSTHLHFIYQMKEYKGCRDCTSHYYLGSSDGCCRKKHNRKWGPPDDGYNSKLRMTPAAERNHPFLRRVPGVDYTKQSNSTNYVSLFPDPIPEPTSAPEPSIALPPLFWDDYQQPYYTPWENNTPDITTDPPMIWDYESYPPIIA